MAYIVCEGLSVGYANHAVATGINFSVSAGDLLCVVGENGAGKSTLVRTLLGLIPPVAGEVRLSEDLGPGGIGYLPQQGNVQRDFPASAWEIALSGRLPHLGRRPFYRAEDRRLADEVLERVGASHLRDRVFSQLSGGQQQRVLLARALCAASRLVVLDEPTTGLDPEATRSLYALLDRLRSEGLAIVAVTHDVREALVHATHVLAVGDGAAFYQSAKAYLAQQREGVR